MFDRMRRDVRTVRERDPAARSALEVVLCYPGVHAIWGHRVAHALWGAGWLTLARWVSHASRFMTGIRSEEHTSDSSHEVPSRMPSSA